MGELDQVAVASTARSEIQRATGVGLGTISDTLDAGGGGAAGLG